MIEEFFLISTHSARLVVFLLVPGALYYKNKKRVPVYLLSLLFVLLITYGLKYGFNIPRPDSAVLDVVTPRFPSGHTSIAFTPVLFFGQWRERIPLLVYAALVAYSRLFFNVHVPIDIIVSVGISLSVSVICLNKEDYINRKLRWFMDSF